jgi:hypothetical protein
MANSTLHPRADDGVQARLGFLSVAGATAGDGGVKLAKSQQSGSLHQYVKKVTGENGEIVEYPKVVGARDRDNKNHWHYQLTWKEKIDGKWRTRCRSVPRNKVESIEQILRDGQGLAVAIENLKSSG